MEINDITYAINGAVFEVNKTLGHGFLEKVYERALAHELERHGLYVETQVPVRVFYKECHVGEYFVDLLVEGVVLVELKVVECLLKIHEAQVLNYLRATGFNVGLLVNFGLPRAEVKRIVNNYAE